MSHVPQNRAHWVCRVIHVLFSYYGSLRFGQMKQASEQSSIAVSRDSMHMLGDVRRLRCRISVVCRCKITVSYA